MQQASYPVSYSGRDWSTLKRMILCALLTLATVHCVESIFVDNLSFMNLTSYENGTEQMPFQGRVAMMPVGQWAERSALMKRESAWIELRIFHGANKRLEPFSSSKVAYLTVGMVASLLAVGFGVFIGRRYLPGVWWLPSALFIYMLYVTYAARADAHYWYPYDLPHFALFGIAAICLLEGWWIAAFLLFLTDLPVRETAVYLVPVAIAMAYARRQWRAMGWAAAMLVLWVVVRVLISRHFAGNASDSRIHWEFWAPALRNPYRWGQLASAFGFLLIPFIWGWKYLNREERFFVCGAIPGVLLTALYGVWYETRIWDEWLLPAALLMSFQAVRAINRGHVSGQLIEERPSVDYRARAAQTVNG